MIRHEARGGLADGLSGAHQREFDERNVITRKAAADWAANVGREMWLAGIQECLKLAKAYVKSEQLRVFDETAQPFDEIDWSGLERELEKL